MACKGLNVSRIIFQPGSMRLTTRDWESGSELPTQAVLVPFTRLSNPAGVLRRPLPALQSAGGGCCTGNRTTASNPTVDCRMHSHSQPRLGMCVKYDKLLPSMLLPTFMLSDIFCRTSSLYRGTPGLFASVYSGT